MYVFLWLRLQFFFNLGKWIRSQWKCVMLTSTKADVTCKQDFMYRSNGLVWTVDVLLSVSLSTWIFGRKRGLFALKVGVFATLTKKSSCGKPQEAYRPRHNLSKCHSVPDGGAGGTQSSLNWGGGTWGNPIRTGLGHPPCRTGWATGTGTSTVTNYRYWPLCWVR